jgi:hypothetical protein
LHGCRLKQGNSSGGNQRSRFPPIRDDGKETAPRNAEKINQAKLEPKVLRNRDDGLSGQAANEVGAKAKRAGGRFMN